MLDYLRKRVKSLFTKIVFGILIVVFAFWGVQVARRGNKGYLASIGKDTFVTVPEFQRELDRRLDMYAKIYGRRPTPSMIKLMGLKESVLYDIINRKLLLLAADDLGVRATDDEIREKVESMKVFRRNGQFIPYLYKTVLRANNLTPEEFESMVANDIVVEKLRNSITESIPAPTEGELYYMYKIDREKLNLLFVSFKPSEFLSKVKVTKEEEKNYYKEHQDEFMTPKKLSGELVILEKSAFLDEVKVKKSDIEEYYNINADDFFVPRSYRLERILIKVPEDAKEALKKKKKALAEKILKRLKKGANFERLAKRYSDDPLTRKKGGDMGVVEENKLEKPVIDAISKLKKGGITGIIKTRKGFEIYKLLSVEPARYKKLNEVKDQIVNILKRKNVGKVLIRRAGEVFDRVSGEGKKPSQVVKDKKIKIIPIKGFFPGESLPFVGSDTSFTEKCFSLKVGELTEPYKTKSGDYAMFYLTGITPPRKKSFKEVEEDIRTLLKNRKAEEACKEEAFRFNDKLLKEKDIFRVSKEFNVKPKETGFFFRRIGHIPGVGWVPKKDLLYAFSNERRFLDSPVRIGKTYFVFQLKGIKVPTKEEFDKDKASFKKEILRESRAEAFGSFIDSLREIYKVKINWNLFKTL